MTALPLVVRRTQAHREQEVTEPATVERTANNALVPSHVPSNRPVFRMVGAISNRPIAPEKHFTNVYKSNLTIFQSNRIRHNRPSYQ